MSLKASQSNVERESEIQSAPSENPLLKGLADYINFLVQVAFAFESRKVFFDRLIDCVEHDEMLEMKQKAVFRIAIIRLGAKPEDPNFSQEDIERCIASCGSNKEMEKHALDLIADISEAVRSFGQFLPASDNPASFSPIKRLEHLYSQNPNGCFTYRLKAALSLHVLKASNTKSEPGSISPFSAEGYRMDVAFLESLLEKDLFLKPILEKTDFQVGPWGRDFVVKSLAFSRGENPWPIRRPHRLSAQQEAALESQPSLTTEEIERCVLPFAPKALVAIKDLFTLIHQVEPYLKNPLMGLLSDLIPIEGFLKSEPHGYQDLLAFLRSKVTNPQALKSIAAEMELRFRQSSSANPHLWMEIGVLSKSSSESIAPSTIEVHLKRIQPWQDLGLNFPTAEDIATIALSDFSIEAAELPQGLAESILESLHNPLDIAMVRHLVWKGIPRDLRLHAVRRRLGFRLPVSLFPEEAVQNICDDSAQLIEGTIRWRLDEVLDNHEQVRSQIQFGNPPPESANESIDQQREKALKSMHSLMGPSQTCALSEEMNRRFLSTETNEFLSTYFDSARVGLIDKVLRYKARDYVFPAASVAPSFSKVQSVCGRGILSSLFPTVAQIDPQYPIGNLCYTKSGTEAFNLFLSVTKGKGKLLVTPEEYGVLWKGKNVEDVKFPKDSVDPMEPSWALDRLLEFLEANSDVRYMLVSDVSRFGTLYPLELFAQARDILRKRNRLIYLIWDGAQSFGRRETDLSLILPDVYMASAFKGSDAGSGGFVLFSKDFLESHNNAKAGGGSDDLELMTRILLASNPLALGVHDVMPPRERQKVVQDLSSKFLSILMAINNPRIKIVRPSHLSRFKNSAGLLAKLPPNELLTGIFEIEVEGLTRHQVSAYARTLGVHLSSLYEDPHSERSVRIAFHPHMGNDSILLLAYALANAR